MHFIFRLFKDYPNVKTGYFSHLKDDQVTKHGLGVMKVVGLMVSLIEKGDDNSLVKNIHQVK